MLQRVQVVFASLVLLIIAYSSVSAATMPLANIAVGQIITVNGMKFAKTSADGKFTAICESNSCGSVAHCTSCSTTNTNFCTQCGDGYYAIGGVCVATMPTMQSFTTANCNAYPTPAGTNYTPVGFLTDERDGKSYEIRKFADGKCWMVDNLAYGGGTDGSSDYCASKTTFRNANSAANAGAITTNGLNPTDGTRTTLVGDCRNNPGSVTYGYLYNWPAVIQNTSGYYNTSFQPTEPTQGICPDGWHIPKGNTTGEYQALHTAVSSNIAFWGPSGNWQGVYSGRCDNSGGITFRGSLGYYWSSTQHGSTQVDTLGFSGNGVSPAGDYSKDGGLSVRCIKD